MASSGGDLPDIIAGLNYGHADQVQFGDAGIFLPIQDYLKDSEMAPNFNQIQDEDLQHKIQMVMEKQMKSR